MKAIDIALKDMKQAFRSTFAIAFMFLIPILVTGLFALLFGGTGGGGEEDDQPMEISPIAVQVINQDEGPLGDILVNLWQGDDLSLLLNTTEAANVSDAKLAVDQQEAEVAIIIPASFSSVMFESDATAQVELYQDPTLTLGPEIVKMMVNQFADSFSGIQITLNITAKQLAAHDLSLTEAQHNQLIQEYSDAIQAIAQNNSLIQTQTPGGDASNGILASILGSIMGGMMVFYAFFTGAYASNTILAEEEGGTLQRLFSTATRPDTILVGKLIAAAIMILVQMTVLIVFGWLVFHVDWGNLLLIVLFILATTLGAATWGMFVISFAKDRRQSGIIMGAGNTVTGMLGMAGIFMLSSPTPNNAIDTISLLVPQGWANRALISIMEGLSLERTLLSLAGLLVWTILFFTIGFLRFRKRMS